MQKVFFWEVPGAVYLETDEIRVLRVREDHGPGAGYGNRCLSIDGCKIADLLPQRVACPAGRRAGPAEPVGGGIAVTPVMPAETGVHTSVSENEPIRLLT
jgi:hypothetical protein